MNNDNLLISLSKYRPRDGHTPLENFITASFAWVLRNNHKFASKFLIKLCGQTDSSIKIINTQVCLSGTYPDMLVQTQSRVFLFEHKTYTRLEENQLGKYREYGNQKYGLVTIVLITGSESQHEQNPDIALTWLNVYQFIQDELPILPESTFLKEFADLLKEHGLGPQPALTYESIISYLPSKNFRSTLGNILKKVHETIRTSNKIESMYQTIGEVVEGNIKWNYDNDKFWGRVGTEYLSVWQPGIFIGCIVDNKDHRNSYKDYSKGIDYCLIVSFDQEVPGCVDYEVDQVYKDFVSELQSRIIDINGYELYNHLSEENPNRWHPLYLRKSLSDILISCETQEQQVEKLVFDAECLAELLITSEKFKELRKKYKVTS